MRNAIIGLVVGLVVGIVVGTTVVAPRIESSLPGSEPEQDAKPQDQAATSESTSPLPVPPAPKPSAASPQPSTPKPAEPAARWRMASAFAATLPQLGTLAKRVETETWRVSGGEMEIAFNPPGALVPLAEAFDAVKSGAIEAAFASPARWRNRSPALELFAAVPFGPSAREYLAWFYFGGGRELFDGVNEKLGVHGLICGMVAPSAAGWFKKRIRTPDDLKGVRMGIVGLGAAVMKRLGVETTALEPGDIFVAFEAGGLDAAAYSMPAIDERLGLQQMAKHYYFPGWHRPATLYQLLINRDAWQALSGTQRAQLESVCGDNVRHGLAEGEALQFQALKRIAAKGIQVRRWPRPVLEALRESWRAVATERAARNPTFKKVWNALVAFRTDYAVWRDLDDR